MRTCVSVLIAAGLLCSCAAAGAQPRALPDGVDIEQKAKEFVQLLVKEDYAACVKQFDTTMKKVSSPKKLKGAWHTTTQRHGTFQKILSVRRTKHKQYDVLYVACELKNSVIDVKVVFDRQRQISGLWFAPNLTAAAYKPPPYVKPGSFREKEVQVGEGGDWVLPATLTLPAGDGPFPAVVLVHGSGPNDRDESLGPNKPFKDLAWGLAGEGVAVLRYEKRTRHYAAKLVASGVGITVKEETIDDALAAVALLRETDEILADKLFVLGHSLGGTLIPRIGARDERVAGFLIMAGTARPLEDVILEQMTYIFGLDGKTDEVEKAQLARLKRQAAKVKDPKLSPDTPADELPFNTPASYWLDLRDYRPAQAAADLKAPIFILQGGRDYQVTMKDLWSYQKALGSREDVQFKVYPKLNHLLIEGEGQCTPAEYAVAGNVSEEVVADIAQWIKEQ